MKLITRWTLAAKAYKDWKNWKNFSDNRVCNKLKQLGKNPDPDDVDRIIGSSAWTTLDSCYECKQEAEALIEFGKTKEIGPEQIPCRICKKCLLKALEIIEP
jgi:hypothetical protein